MSYVCQVKLGRDPRTGKEHVLTGNGEVRTRRDPTAARSPRSCPRPPVVLKAVIPTPNPTQVRRMPTTAREHDPELGSRSTEPCPV